MTGSCFAVYHKKRHRRYWKKRMTAWVELINLVRSLGIDSEDWGIIGQKWSLTPSLRQTMSRLSGPCDFIHQAPGYLRSTTSTWPFEMWGMDVVGPISPPSSKGHRFILTDYFSKWAKAIPLREVKSSDVIKFVKHHVIYRFGMPRRIIHDNGSQLSAKLFKGSATSSESRVCPQRHTTQPLTASQKLSTRLLESFSKNSFWKANVTGTTN